MTPEQQRIAIAEACGWKRVAGSSNLAWGADADKNKCWMYVHQLPDYLNDLNAMHEAEKVLPYEKLLDYFRTLEGILDRENKSIVAFAVGRATATQRAEAFLKTLNLWTA